MKEFIAEQGKLFEDVAAAQAVVTQQGNCDPVIVPDNPPPAAEEEMDDFDFLGLLPERFFDDEASAADDGNDTPTVQPTAAVPDEIPGPSGVSTPAASDLSPALSESVGRPVPVFATPPDPTSSSSSTPGASNVRRNPPRAAKQDVSYVEEEEDDIHDYCKCVKLV